MVSDGEAVNKAAEEMPHSLSLFLGEYLVLVDGDLNREGALNHEKGVGHRVAPLTEQLPVVDRLEHQAHKDQ